MPYNNNQNKLKNETDQKQYEILYIVRDILLFYKELYYKNDDSNYVASVLEVVEKNLINVSNRLYNPDNDI